MKKRIMATVVKSFAIQGIEGHNVDIETKILDGQPMTSIIGMGDTAVKESADRIQSAIDCIFHLSSALFPGIQST